MNYSILIELFNINWINGATMYNDNQIKRIENQHILI